MVWSTRWLLGIRKWLGATTFSQAGCPLASGSYPFFFDDTDTINWALDPQPPENSSKSSTDLRRWRKSKPCLVWILAASLWSRQQREPQRKSIARPGTPSKGFGLR
ncbi:hypothetical protein CFRS1_v006520 [Colletotrichum fructicola]|nr:hypothetical protein CFRS1_v006520 [Colletotrichum fructicola]